MQRNHFLPRHKKVEFFFSVYTPFGKKSERYLKLPVSIKDYKSHCSFFKMRKNTTNHKK